MNKRQFVRINVKSISLIHDFKFNLNLKACNGLVYFGDIQVNFRLVFCLSHFINISTKPGMNWHVVSTLFTKPKRITVILGYVLCQMEYWTAL